MTPCTKFENRPWIFF